MYNIILVFLGSGLGGALRWLISTALNATYPIGTMTVNVVGCLLIGMLNAWIAHLAPSSDAWRLLLVVGFCGGFTTFSTFANENVMMLRGGQLLECVLYTAASVILGFLAVWIGGKIINYEL